VITFFIILTIVFILPRIMPGDPIQNILGIDYVSATQEEKDFLTNLYGLDKGIFEQYFLYLKSIFTLDFGYSISTDANVGKTLFSGMKYSAMVSFPALLIGATLALFAGLYGGTKKGSVPERGLTAASIFVTALPSFLLAMILLTVFSYYLGWFPLGHMSTGKDVNYLVDLIYSLTLPIGTLALMVFCSYYIIIKNIVLQIEEEHFINVKRLHGFSDDYINSKHITRNISTQFVSVLALSLGGIISGSLIVEIVFSLPGIGGILFSAISFGDYPVIQACFIFITFSILLANLVAEILYSLLDPRVADKSGWI